MRAQVRSMLQPGRRLLGQVGYPLQGRVASARPSGVPTARQVGACKARWGTRNRQVQFCMIQAALYILQSLAQVECIDY